MRVRLVSTHVTSPFYMSRAYVKKFGKIVLSLFDYIFVHGRMLREVHPWFESYVMSLRREIIAYEFVEHEVGRLDIFHSGPIIEHGKGDAPCRYSFQIITYLVVQGSKGFFYGMITFRYFKVMKKVIGSCSMSTTLGFS